MREKDIKGVNLHKKKKWGVLIGIPLSLFVFGITLITIGSYSYLKNAFFLSGILITQDYKPNKSIVEINDKEIDNKIKSIYPKFGEKFGDLTIQSISISYPVYNGDLDEQLSKGIGHFFGSRYPGENGNVVLAAHRNTQFKTLGNVKVGDKVNFDTTYGKYVYVVDNIRITDGNDNTITNSTDGEERLTLYTCYPFNYIGNAPKRYVLTCSLLEGTPISSIIKGGN